MSLERAVRMAVMTEYQTAEKSLYPLVLSDADLYERATTLVGRAAGRLDGITELEVLIARVDNLVYELPSMARAAHISSDGLPLPSIAKAAGAMRLRAILATEETGVSGALGGPTSHFFDR